MEARKFSKKRAAILEALRATDEHPSAEMLYAGLKGRFPDLSLGTVYRNLAMFVADGDAVIVGNVAGQSATTRTPRRTPTSYAAAAGRCWTSARPASPGWTARWNWRPAAGSRRAR